MGCFEIAVCVHLPLVSGSCPRGYMYLSGSGTGSLVASHSLAPDLCQDKCNEDDSCAGYETNTRLGTCQLDTLVGPSNPPISDQVFCSKLCKVLLLVLIVLSISY